MGGRRLQAGATHYEGTLHPDSFGVRNNRLKIQGSTQSATLSFYYSPDSGEFWSLKMRDRFRVCWFIRLINFELYALFICFSKPPIENYAGFITVWFNFIYFFI
jgi:hypothetical protein